MASSARSAGSPVLSGSLQRRVLDGRARILGTAEARRAVRDETSQHTRDIVLRAAVSLFAELGFDACTMRDLAESAGIKPPALYNHFSSKEQILTEAMWLALGDFFAAVLVPLVDEEPVLWLDHLVWRHAFFQLQQQHLTRANDLLIQREGIARHMPSSEHAAFVGTLHDYFTIVRDLSRTVSGTPSSHRATVDAFAILSMCDRVSVWYRPEGVMSQEEVADLICAAVRRLLMGAR